MLIHNVNHKVYLLENFGDLKYKKGDYVIIPRGVIWTLSIIEKTKMLVVESSCPIETPTKYRNRFGQLLESSPYCERDIKTPNLLVIQIYGIPREEM